jgi:hypothetical protein
MGGRFIVDVIAGEDATMKYNKLKPHITKKAYHMGIEIGRQVFLEPGYAQHVSVYCQCMTPVNMKKYIHREWKSIYRFRSSHINGIVRLGLGEEYEVL